MGKNRGSLAIVQLRRSEIGPTMQEDQRPGVFKLILEGPDQNVRPESVGPDQDDGQVQFIGLNQSSRAILNFGQAHILRPALYMVDPRRGGKLKPKEKHSLLWADNGHKPKV